MTLTGQIQIKEALAKKLSDMTRISNAALLEAGLMIEGRAIEKTPKDTGNLRSSFKTTAIKNGVLIENHAEYALVQHEDLELSHEVGEAKFLEKAINESLVEVKEIIERDLKKGILK